MSKRANGDAAAGTPVGGVITVADLQRRSHRPGLGSEGEPATAALPVRSGHTTPAVRRSAVAAGVLLAAGSLLGAAVVTTAAPAAETGREERSPERPWLDRVPVAPALGPVAGPDPGIAPDDARTQPALPGATADDRPPATAGGGSTGADDGPAPAGDGATPREDSGAGDRDEDTGDGPGGDGAQDDGRGSSGVVPGGAGGNGRGNGGGPEDAPGLVRGVVPDLVDPAAGLP